jgi:phytoene synthase
MREATHVLYGFFRVADEIVDTPDASDTRTAETRLNEWKAEWKKAYDTRTSNHPVLRATAEVFYTYTIPFEYSEAFLDAMARDLTVTRYETYRDLETYMYGSAAVVGLMMSYIIGFSSPVALAHAKALGEAMQLTNFLRDIKEDLARGRMYLPLEDLKRFDVSIKDLEQGRITPAFADLMQFEINRCRDLYQKGNNGLQYLTQQGRFPVAAASCLYAGILHVIEAKGYDVFTERCRTSRIEKIRLLLQAKRLSSF